MSYSRVHWSLVVAGFSLVLLDLGRQILGIANVNTLMSVLFIVEAFSAIIIFCNLYLISFLYETYIILVQNYKSNFKRPRGAP